MRTPFNLAAFYRSVFQAIEEVRLSGLKRLETLDLSRNNIGRLGANAFSGLSALTKLDLSLNALRTVGIVLGVVVERILGLDVPSNSSR